MRGLELCKGIIAGWKKVWGGPPSTAVGFEKHAGSCVLLRNPSEVEATGVGSAAPKETTGSMMATTFLVGT
jgi:hypothetical protein